MSEYSNSVRTLEFAGECERLISGNVKMGKCCWIGPWVILDGYHKDIVIGDNVTICAGVKIYTHTNEGGKSYKASVTIDNDVFIGSNAVIEPNVFIGRGGIIGANSFVKRGTMVLDGELWAGAPAVNKGVWKGYEKP